MAHEPSNGLDAPPSRYTVFLESGRVFKTTDYDTLREAALSRSEIAELHDALTNSGLGSLPQVNYFPPDGAHIVIGVRQRGQLKRYAWTGDERTFGSNISASDRTFIDAFSKAQAALARSVPSTWASVTDGRESIAQLVAEIYGQ